MKSGIYKFKNIENGKFYIGKATSIGTRSRTHFNDLLLGKHINEDLQNDWNEFGPSAFTFRVLELCKEEDMSKLEQKYINENWGLGVLYNSKRICDNSLGRNINSMKTRYIGSKTTGELPVQGTNALTGKKIYFPSIISVEEKGFTFANVHHAATIKVGGFHLGFQWSLFEGECLPPDDIDPDTIRYIATLYRNIGKNYVFKEMLSPKFDCSIISVDVDTGKVFEFDNAQQAKEYFEYGAQGNPEIWKCLSGKKCLFDRKVWFYRHYYTKKIKNYISNKDMFSLASELMPDRNTKEIKRIFKSGAPIVAISENGDKIYKFNNCSCADIDSKMAAKACSTEGYKYSGRFWFYQYEFNSYNTDIDHLNMLDRKRRKENLPAQCQPRSLVCTNPDTGKQRFFKSYAETTLNRQLLYKACTGQVPFYKGLAWKYSNKTAKSTMTKSEYFSIINKKQVVGIDIINKSLCLYNSAFDAGQKLGLGRHMIYNSANYKRKSCVYKKIVWLNSDFATLVEDTKYDEAINLFRQNKLGDIRQNIIDQTLQDISELTVA